MPTNPYPPHHQGPYTPEDFAGMWFRYRGSTSVHALDWICDETGICQPVAACHVGSFTLTGKPVTPEPTDDPVTCGRSQCKWLRGARPMKWHLTYGKLEDAARAAAGQREQNIRLRNARQESLFDLFAA